MNDELYKQYNDPAWYKEYLLGLARKRASCGAVLWHGGKILVVKPTYKDAWSIPGGVVDALESPMAGCLRECREELGLHLVLDKLLVVDWVPEEQAGTHDAVQFIFGGPELTRAQLDSIVLPADELERWALMDPEEALPLLGAKLRRQVEGALKGERGVYLEDGAAVL